MRGPPELTETTRDRVRVQPTDAPSPFTEATAPFPLGGRVRFDDFEWTLRPGEPPTLVRRLVLLLGLLFWFLLPFATTLGTWEAIMANHFPFMVVGALSTLLWMFATPVFGALAWMTQRRRVRVGVTGVRSLGKAQLPTNVRLTGTPGGRLSLMADRTLLFAVTPGFRTDWSYDGMVALGQALADHMDVPFRMGVDEEAWRRYADRRARLLEGPYTPKELSRYAAQYALPPKEPADARWTHDGVAAYGLEVSATHLRVTDPGLVAKLFGGAGDLPLTSIDQVRMRLQDDPNTHTRGVWIEVTMGRQVRKLAHAVAKPDRVAGTAWLIDQIDARLGRSQDTGAASAVPRELEALRRG